MSKSTPLISAEHLCRHYEGGSVRALHDVSFAACRGEVVALTGPSGCGKSTLLSLLGLLDRPTSGSIRFQGDDMAAIARPHAFRACNVGFVFQFHHLVASMTLQENVQAPMLAMGIPRSQRQAAAQTILEELGLAARASFLPANVSGGERQRAAVARALINRPALLLADEPTGNLDSRNGQTVVDLLVAHARVHGALVLIATHNPDIAHAMDRSIELLDGELVSAHPSPNNAEQIAATI